MPHERLQAVDAPRGTCFSLSSSEPQDDFFALPRGCGSVSAPDRAASRERLHPAGARLQMAEASRACRGTCRIPGNRSLAVAARKRGADSRRVTEPRASASGPSTNSASTSAVCRGPERLPTDYGRESGVSIGGPGAGHQPGATSCFLNPYGVLPHPSIVGWFRMR
jgi:hypothetical protein